MDIAQRVKWLPKPRPDARRACLERGRWRWQSPGDLLTWMEGATKGEMRTGMARKRAREEAKGLKATREAKGLEMMMTEMAAGKRRGKLPGAP